MLLTLTLLISWRCGEEDFPVPQASTVAADFTFSFADGDFAPAEVNFTSTSTVVDGAGTVTYLWNFGDGSTGEGASATHSYAEPGDYTVSLVVQSSDDLDATTQTVTVRDPNALAAEVVFFDAATATINNLNGTSFSVPGFGTGLAYDATNEKLYFTDDDNGTLNRANFDGSGQEVLVTGLSAPRDVALDIANNRAWVTDRGAGVDAVIEVDLTDNSTAVLYDNATDGLGQLPVGIDYFDGFVYITCVDIDAEAVWKGNVDGSGVTRIIDFGAGGFGYGIAIDPANEKIYFDNANDGQIMTANLDGSSVQPIIEVGNRVYGMAIDNANGKVYWTERNSGNVFMANLNGTGRVTIGAGFTDPRGLVFR